MRTVPFLLLATLVGSGGVPLAGAEVGASDADSALMHMVLAQENRAALAEVDQRLFVDSDGQADQGLLYLRARLLSRLGRNRDAASAYADALAGFEPLRAHARLGLAAVHIELGHPETSAGLAAALLANPGHPQLEAEALRVLRAALAAGGDCRLLEGLQPRSLTRAELGRALRVTWADCQARAGYLSLARRELLALTREKIEDEPALDAALRLAATATSASSADRLSIARVLQHHRLFEEALVLLEPLAQELPASLTRRDDLDVLYLAGRSHFWQEHWAEATLAFGELSRRATAPGERARALYQQGRSEELAGHSEAAFLSFARAVDIDPTGSWSSAALTSAMRIEWLAGRRERAGAILARLASQSRWRDAWGRARLFVVASLVEEGDHAQALLMLQGLDASSAEVAYWRFRSEALAARPAPALAALVQLVRRDPLGPFAQVAAQELLSFPSLHPIARQQATSLASSSSLEDLAAALFLFEALGDTTNAAVVRRLSERQLQAGATTRPLSALLALGATGSATTQAPRPWTVSQWPREDAMDVLLTLGLWEEVSGGRLLARFPPSEPSLLVAASQLLASGVRPREGVRLSEILAGRLRSRVPMGLFPAALIESLYPRPWLATVRSETARRGVEPALLLAIVREESRFDPRALSEASARGLTQFVMPTARRLAPRIGREQLGADDLYRPEVALALGAAYLAALHVELPAVADVEAHLVVAAYNAGEPQARLWRSYCVSSSRAEYLTKVGFAQTRGYLDRVLRSREIYRRDPLLRGGRRVAVDPPAGARPAGR